MKRSVIIGLAIAVSACGGDAKNPSSDVALSSVDLAKAELTAAAEVVVIGTKDGKKIYADHVPAPHAKATIVLFHQADSSAHEYADIAPRLNEAGYSTLAVDQRSGGNLYGPNRTVDRIGKSAPHYVDALPDMEAALNWARLQGQPVVLMGSSYSAGLIFRLASDNPDLVAALIAYSPGEYFDDKHLVRTAAAKLRIPVFISQARSAEELAQSRSIYDALTMDSKTLFEPRTSGVHGASTLRSDKNAAGAADNWQALMEFLKSLRLPTKAK